MLKKTLQNQKGFTLIEIIAVLIILGILAAVAVPKYMNLQADAEKAAAKGVVSELNGRVSIAYAKAQLNGGSSNGGDVGNAYNGFNGVIEGWDGYPTNVGDGISALKREDGSTTFAATWRAGSANGPGFWNNVQ